MTNKPARTPLTRFLHSVPTINPDPTIRTLAPTSAQMQAVALFERTDLLECCGTAMDSRIVDEIQESHPVVVLSAVRKLAAEYGTGGVA